jgi:MFS family permease
MIWIFQLTTVLLGGLLLNHLPDTALGQWMIATFKGFQGEHGRELVGLSILMLIALVCRVISTWLLASIPETEPLPAGPGGTPHRYVSPIESLRNITHSHESKLIAYFLMMAFASNISLGFLVPWMLGPIGQPAHHQAFLMGSLMLGRIVIYFFSGSFINRLGPRKVFLLAATGVVFAHAPLLLTPAAASLLDGLQSPGGVQSWISRNPELAFVMLVQFVAGMMQAVYDLTSWLLLIRHTQPHERTSMTATCWSGFWAACFLGTFVGGLILQQGGFAVPTDPAAPAGTPAPKAYTYDGYLWLFAISTLLRMATLIPLWTWVRSLPEE